MTDIVTDPTGAAPVAFLLPWRTDRPSIHSVAQAVAGGTTPAIGRLPDARDDTFAHEVLAAIATALLAPSPPGSREALPAGGR